MLRVALIQYGWCHYKKGEIWTQRQIHTERRCEETHEEHCVSMEDGNDASISQGIPKNARKPPEARKRQGRISQRVSWEHGPANVLMLVDRARERGS